MKKIFTALLLLGGTYLGASAQDVQLNKGWKFAVGDSAQWSSPTFNDQNWQNKCQVAVTPDQLNIPTTL